MKSRLFFAAMAVLCTTFAAHVYAHYQILYWNVWWLDIPMHFSGGIGVGFLGLWYAAWRGYLPENSRKVLVRDITIVFNRGIVPWWWSIEYPVAFIAVIAPVWEVIEVLRLAYFSIPIPAGYIGDTTLDLFLGGLGTLIAWAAFHRVQYGTWEVSPEALHIDTQHN